MHLLAAEGSGTNLYIGISIQLGNFDKIDYTLPADTIADLV